MSPSITVQQLAERWGVSEDHVLHLIHSGALKAFSVSINVRGKRPRWRIRESAVSDFEDGRASQTPRSSSKRKRPTESIPDYIG